MLTCHLHLRPRAGRITGAIEYNTFKNAQSGNSGGVIANLADVGDLDVCGVWAFEAIMDVSAVLKNVGARNP